MSDGNELLGKADALLARLRSSTDSEFPVLTEIVEVREHVTGTTGQSTVGRVEHGYAQKEVDEICRQLKIQFLQKLEPVTMRWLEETFQSRMRTGFEHALNQLLEKATQEAKLEIYSRLERAIDEVIEAEIRTSNKQ